MLTEAEIADLDETYFAGHREQAIEVWRCGRALDTVSEVAAVPSAAWTLSDTVTGVIVAPAPGVAQEIFGTPNVGRALLRARYDQAGVVQAGDVLRCDGRVYLAREPMEDSQQRARVRVDLERVPAGGIPERLRPGYVLP